MSGIKNDTARLRMPKYVQHFIDRTGRPRFYLRRRGFKRISLPGLPYSPAFMAAYEDALHRTGGMEPIGRSRYGQDSISSLIALYYSSGRFARLAPDSKATIRARLERLRTAHGTKRFTALRKHHIRQMMDKLSAKPNAANNLLRTIRLLLNFAKERELLSSNPADNIAKLSISKDGWKAWSEDEIAAYQRYWPIDTRAYLAFALFLYTAQRRTDVWKMCRAHIVANTISVAQQKTKQRLAIPIHPQLAAAIEFVPTAQLSFILNKNNRPFKSAAAFGNWFGKCVQAAGLKGVSAHGLRKAACRRLAEVGCSAHEIQAISGHKTLSELETYTKSASQKHLANSAMRRLIESE